MGSCSHRRCRAVALLRGDRLAEGASVPVEGLVDAATAVGKTLSPVTETSYRSCQAKTDERPTTRPTKSPRGLTQPRRPTRGQMMRAQVPQQTNQVHHHLQKQIHRLLLPGCEFLDAPQRAGEIEQANGIATGKRLSSHVPPLEWLSPGLRLMFCFYPFQPKQSFMEGLLRVMMPNIIKLC